MTDRRYTKQLPAPVGYLSSNQWNINEISAKYVRGAEKISVSLGKRSPIGGAVEAELCMDIAGWRALITAVAAVLPSPYSPADLFVANVSGAVSA
jgi:hypothetical protein